jgi:hypothetical protein
LTVEQALKLDVKTKNRPQQTAPYSKKELRNIYDRIKYTELRLWELDKLDKMVQQTIPFCGGRIIVDIAGNKIKIEFDEKPSDELTDKLTFRGFRKSRKGKYWFRMRNLQSLWAAYAAVGLKIPRTL